MVTVHKITQRKHGKVRVTFLMPAIEDCGCLYLVGKFDEWNHESVYRMQCTEDGRWSLTLELEPGQEYQYRFRTLDGRWISDPTPLPAPVAFRSNDSFVNTSAMTTLSV
jgi:1,4-alpha-glucan branching enzyme